MAGSGGPAPPSAPAEGADVRGTSADALPPARRSARADAASAMASKVRRGVVSFLRILWANPLSFVGFVLVVVIAVMAFLAVVAPGLVLLYPPNQLSTAYHQAPSWAHPLGTDELGRDIYSNVVAALPIDLAIGFSVAGISLVAGGALGLVAGYWDRPGTLGGIVSVTIMRLADIFLSFPSLVLALAIAASIGRTVDGAIVAVLVTWWPYYVRLARGEVLSVKHQPYVMAARAAGVREGRILLRHVLRNVLEPLVVYFTMDVGTVIVVISTIFYVVQVLPYPSATPEWGSMIEYYQSFLSTYPWTVLAPGVAIFVTVLAFSLLGDGLRDILDPRSRRAQAEAGSAMLVARAEE